MSKKIKLEPQCLQGKMELGITNNGELIPCCYCDSAHTRGNPEYEKLLSVSKINEYEKVEDILETPEWKEFEGNLKNNIGFPACERTCIVRSNEDDVVKKLFTTDLDSNTIKKYTV